MIKFNDGVIPNIKLCENKNILILHSIVINKSSDGKNWKSLQEKPNPQY